MGRPLVTSEAFLYGRFVQAAYSMFAQQNPDPLRPEPVGIPDGYEVGAWIHMSDFIFADEIPKFYGIVAFDQANPDSRIIAIRGTEGAIEWIDDAAAIPVPFRQVPSAGRVAQGFDKIYSTLKIVKRPLPGFTAHAQMAVPETFSGSFADQLEQLASSREAERGIARPRTGQGSRPQRPTVVAGHSLGSSLATLFVMENATKRKFDVSTLCTFASPRVGDTQFMHIFNQLPIDSWRIVNSPDVVPKLPFSIPIVLDYGHVDAPYFFDSSTFAKKSVLAWHVLETYLHWLDNTYPLRPDCCLQSSPQEGTPEVQRVNP